MSVRYTKSALCDIFVSWILLSLFAEKQSTLTEIVLNPMRKLCDESISFVWHIFRSFDEEIAESGSHAFGSEDRRLIPSTIQNLGLRNSAIHFRDQKQQMCRVTALLLDDRWSLIAIHVDRFAEL
jgi:hypothetical protein